MHNDQWRWYHPSKREAGLYKSRVRLLAKVSFRSQIWDIGHQEADRECGTACDGTNPNGVDQERIAEGGWSVITCGEKVNMEVQSFVPLRIDTQHRNYR